MGTNIPQDMGDVSDVARVFAARAIRGAFGGRVRDVDTFGDVVKGDPYGAVRVMVAATREGDTFTVNVFLARRGEGYAATATRVVAVASPSIAADMLDAYREGE